MVLKHHPWLIALAICCMIGRRQTLTKAEVFSAVADLEQLLHKQNAVADALHQFIEMETTLLRGSIMRFADSMKRQAVDGLANPETLGNPVFSFILMKRLTADLTAVRETVKRNVYEFESRLSQLSIDELVSSNDLRSTAMSLFRLQSMYKLTTKRMANGIVSDSLSMTADDCLHVAIAAAQANDFYNAILWTTEALSRHKKEVFKTAYLSHLYEWSQYALFKRGNIQHALQLTNEWLSQGSYTCKGLKAADATRLVWGDGSQKPDNARAQEIKKRYEAELMVGMAVVAAHGTTADFEPHGKPFNEPPENSADHIAYERFCRGEKIREYSNENRLTCHYSRHHPKFYIRPVKEEIVYDNPRISVYYDIITEPEFRQIQKLALPKINRSMVFDPVENKVSDIRISKQSWLADNEDVVVEKISHRIGSVVNLSIETSEELQVLNYGLGGMYLPHLDSFTEEALLTNFPEVGNRIATFLCYMTTVRAGGATIFPLIGVHVKPEQGSCVLWYNLHKNGTQDQRSLHSGCPVLLGNKWAFNKWFRMVGQEFLRPCSTDKDE